MASDAQQSLPLAGIRVVEFAHMVMGPTCGLVLADLGAEVIKIEPVGEGDKTRRLTGSGTGFFPTYNRNKKSLAVDIKSEAGREAVLKLIDTADVFAENFRPGAMDRAGFGYETLSERNPRLVYVSHKGFLDGPYQDRTALDEVVQMMTGLAYMTGLPGRPLRAGASVNDVMGGMFGAIATLAALRRRDATGKGEFVTSGLFENSVFLVGQHMAQAEITGQKLNPMSVRSPAWGIYDIFETSDGEMVFASVVTDIQWRKFCDEFELPELAADPDLDTNPKRCAARPTLIPRVAEILARYTKADLIDRLARAGLPHADVATPEAMIDDPHLKASDGLVEVTLDEGKSIVVPALPVAFSGERLHAYSDLPGIGEHGPALLADIGYSAEEIAELTDAGVISVSTRKR
ncbi:CaiB/BaiF CoA transferase family protein [Acuticoccus mangrovi]|uniref:CoA transferase n=1 Tax=Acuticoccus mangrovi TaxID=2796142 RepID=A0A934IL06_9HYPH|nr:CaiB/BaiF CoA-transferase family protein [Acuticoccus mangrovi]MBJ3775742.1 CoA transferase [Acuticoccus mangrovi]